MTYGLRIVILLFLLMRSLVSLGGHYVIGSKIEYHFIHPDSLEIVLTLKSTCFAYGMTGGEAYYYSAQYLHIARNSDTLLDSLDYYNSYLNHSICPDSASSCLSGNLQFSTAIFEYRKVFPLSRWQDCEITFYWQEETFNSGSPGRAAYITTGHAATISYAYAYLNHCQIQEANSPYISRDFPDVIPRFIDFVYSFGIQTDDPVDDSIYVDLIMPMGPNGQAQPYSGHLNYNKPVTFYGMPNHTISLPGGFHVDHHCGALLFRPTISNEAGAANLRIQRFVRRNDSAFKVSEINYNFTIYVVGNNDYRYYFPQPPVYNQSWCIDARGNGQPRNPGPQLICTRDSILLETPDHPDLHYAWFKNGVELPGDTFRTYWASDSGTYRVRTNNGFTGCERYSIDMEVKIDDGSIPLIQLSEDRPYCLGDTATIERDTGQYSWVQWRRNDRPYSLDSALFLRTSHDGAYALDVINERGCRVRSNELELLFNPPNPAPLFASPQRDLCIPFLDTLMPVRKLFRYGWMDDTTQTDSFFVPYSSMTVILGGMDTLGCQVRDSVRIIGHDAPPSAIPGDTALCPYVVNMLLRAQDPPVLQSHYLWSTGSSDTLLQMLFSDSGNYWLQITDSIGCKRIDSFSILRHRTLYPDLGPDTSFCPALNPEYLMEAKGLTESGLHYLWSTGDSIPLITAKDTGWYGLSVNDSFGCTFYDSVRLSYYPADPVRLPEDTMICGNELPARLLHPLSAEQAGYRYFWNRDTVNSRYSYLLSDSGWTHLEQRDANHCSSMDSSHLGQFPSLHLDLGSDTTLCEAEEYPLYVQGNTTFIWPDQSSDTVLNVTEDGLYWLEVRNGDACFLRDSVMVRFDQIPDPRLLDSVLCERDYIDLETGGNYPLYTWHNGFRGPVLRLYDTGLVWVIAQNDCGQGYDSAWVRGCRFEPPYIYIPNAFSPNKDAYNQNFRIEIEEYREFKLLIFNRWGQLLYETHTPDEGWDGTFLGQEVPQEGYLFLIEVVGMDHKLYRYHGTLTLLR